MFNDELADFAQVASFVLALLTIFTGARASALQRLELTPGSAKKPSGSLEIMLCVVVLLASAGVIVSGIPLWLQAFEHACLTRAGALPLSFVISWPVMLGLVAWQVALVRKAIWVRGKLPATPPK